MTSTLPAQFTFLNEADRLKSVDRANLLIDCSRPENSAEHSWHLALYALVFGDTAAPDVDVDRAIAMLLLHDIVEIDAGDHPIHEAHDWDAVAEAERKAADRIFGLLPLPQAKEFRGIWDEFEAAKTPTAKFAKRLDTAQPMYQTLCAPNPVPDHVEVVRGNLTTGRARPLAESWPEAYAHAKSMLDGTASTASTYYLLRLAFLLEACKLKSVYRATKLCDGSRHENSGEHSWHIALYAMTLASHAIKPVNIGRVIRMLLIHDLVEIDAGDTPIHGDFDPAEQEQIERLAADRLFGLLPPAQGAKLRALWEEFEAAESDDAIFAKSIDRVQPLASNLENGGGSWPDYNVSYAQLVGRVGDKIAKGSPAVWAEVDTRIRAHPWFAKEFQK